MVIDFDCNTKLVQPNHRNLSNKPSRLASRWSMPMINTPSVVSSSELWAGSENEPACSDYERYVRLAELEKLWKTREFPGWDNESVIKPGLHGLEITFRFISVILSDTRPYVNWKEWERRLEGLVRDELEIISVLCEEDETRGAAPIVDLSSPGGVVVAHTGSSTEVWKLSGGEHETTVVSRSSESSLLPRLAAWQRSSDIASRIFYAIESAMKRCSYTLGVGEPNLDGKPNLDYDAICTPSELHALKLSTLHHIQNDENPALFTVHQILESWIFVARQILTRVVKNVEDKQFDKASDDCWVLQRIWKLLEQIENLHILMDPDDFLRLKTQLRIKATFDCEAFCFRSRRLVEIAKESKELRHKVPSILAVQVDPTGGPVVQEAAMAMYREKRSYDKIHLLQAFQGVESAVKGFFFNYKQLLIIMVGSLEAHANRSVIESEPSDLLSQIFMEPTYYPSLDGAKTFIGDFWEHDRTARINCKTIKQ